MSLTAEQLAVRAEGVGASEAAAALGLSPYCTPLQLYERKLGVAGPTEENRAMRFGNFAEGFILAEFQREHPEYQLVVAPDTMRRGPMLAHLDAWVPGQVNVQAKTARGRNGWGESGSDQVPQHYLIQVQAEMMLAKVTVSFVPVLFGGADYDEFVVEADRELQEIIESGVNDFWRRVQSGEPPAPTTYAEAVQRWGRSSMPRSVLATAEAEEACFNLRRIKAAREDLEAQEEAARLQIVSLLGDADTLVDLNGSPIATWKASAGAKRFDAAAFKEAHPDLHAAFMKQGEPCRRFLLK